MLLRRGKKAQVTIFIIVALVLVVLVASYFIFKDKIQKESVPENFQRIENSFLNCVESQVSEGVLLLETQGGYIFLPEYKAGSIYSPFSSYMNFMGIKIPYWYYLSAANLPKEQVPTKERMEEDLEKFLKEVIPTCSFKQYLDEGYEISQTEPEVNVNIQDNNVKASIDMKINAIRGEESYSFETHEISLNSKLGNLYDDAVELYNQELNEMFLENYSIDVLRLYAPVDGVELSCKPLVWNAHDVISELRDAFEANTLALKTFGSKKDYFVIDTSIDSEARFITSRNWQGFYEIIPAEGELLVARPLGNQNSMGILGFCYVPYHFVYNIKYPVVIQVYQGEEFFQFPFGVVIQGNKPREALIAGYDTTGIEDFNLCSDKLTSVKINLVDNEMNPINGNVSYGCLGSVCDIGETIEGQLQAQFPQCVNGNLIINSNGFAEYREIQTIVENNSFILASLSKEFLMNLEIIANDKTFDGSAIINFVSEKGVSSTIVYPEKKTIKLNEGEYEIQIYLYGAPEFELINNTYKQCVGGYILGIGQRCYNVELPEEMTKNVLIGGGKLNYYFMEDELSSSNTLVLDSQNLRIPKTLEELQENYAYLGSKEIEVSFK